MEEKGSWSIRGNTAQAHHLAKLLAVQYGETIAHVVHAAVAEVWAFYLTRPAEYPASFDELMTMFRHRWLPPESTPAAAPGRTRGNTSRQASRNGGA